VSHEFAEHEACGVGGDRKADALRAHDHCSVDPDHFPARGHERPAGVIWRLSIFLHFIGDDL
jgi:hypothetical protein